MDDFILLPDDETMERLAAEYKKVKVKNFAAANVSTLSARKRYKIKRKVFSPNDSSAELDKLTELLSDGIALFRKLSKYAADAVAKEGLFALSLSKRESLEMLAKCGLYGQNTIKCLDFHETTGYRHLKRAVSKNALDTVNLLLKLRRDSAHTVARATFNNLLEREYINSLTLFTLLD